MNLKNHVKFFEEIKNQFQYGGTKYAQSSEKEATDCLFDDFGKNWLFGTLAKYVKRYSNLGREKDLLKIACYVFIIWLKRGFHYGEYGTSEIINTTVEIKSKYFELFIQKVFNFMIDFNYSQDIKEDLNKIYNILLSFGNTEFQNIKEQNLFYIFALCYYIWETDIPDNKKGSDQDVYNEQRGDNNNGKR